MATVPDYGEIVKQAEVAVRSIKDIELRKIAFQKLLETLLTQSRAPRREGEEVSRSRASGSAASRRSGSRPGRKKDGPTGYVKELIEESFFKAPKSLGEVRTELGNRGHHVPLTSLSRPMMLLCRDRFLRRQKEKSGNKVIFTYSNW